jgi:beta-aspartyl-peptidase (threonine type)
MSSPSSAAVLVAVGIVTSGIIGAQHRSPDRTIDSDALISQLQATTVNWTRGDLDGFIAPYAPQSTYMTSEGPVDRATMREHYRTRYFSGSTTPRPLRFEQITVRPLGDDHALMTGRFVLSGDGKADQSGWFTLVWLRTVDGWRILHDHSS